VLYTLTENDFQEAFQKWRRRWDRCLPERENYFESDGSRYALWWVLWFLQCQSGIFWIHTRISYMISARYNYPILYIDTSGYVTCMFIHIFLVKYVPIWHISQFSTSFSNLHSDRFQDTCIRDMQLGGKLQDVCYSVLRPGFKHTAR
jgi:hypothetical protein